MRVGSVVYATEQGLGVLAKSFFDAGVLTDVLVVRHGRHRTHDEWYPGAPQVADVRNPHCREKMADFCSSMDAMLFFETPFNWDLIPHCRLRSVKTILMPMYECMPENLPFVPDAYLNPSLLDQKYYPQGTHIPVPVSVPWRQRERVEVFVHNAGHGGLKGRNGTRELVEAMRYTKSPAKLILREQKHSNWPPYSELFGKVDYRPGTFPHEKLFEEGDAFVFPEKFNGLSLPLQEARASGMLVMCLDRFPMNEWLPNNTEPDSANVLIPLAGTNRNRIGPPYNEFDEAVADPRAIAAKIDEWYGRDVREYSLSGQQWAKDNSWDALRPRYVEFIERVVRGTV